MAPPALIFAAVTAGVGSAIAFELAIFKPWREEHWPNGWQEGIKQDWEEFAENIKEGFQEISGDFRRQREAHHRPWQRRSSNSEEEMQLRREVDEFSLHEAQVSCMRARHASEFNQSDEGARMRKTYTSSKASSVEDGLGLSTLDYRPSLYRSQDDNETLTGTDVESPHHTVGEESPRDKTARLTDNEGLQPIVTSSQYSQDDSDSALRSPLSVTALTHTDDGTISDDWQSRFSPRSAPEAPSEDEEGSDVWEQLNNSQAASPLSPLSPSWSETELVREER